jgi:hypothetical protein
MGGIKAISLFDRTLQKCERFTILRVIHLSSQFSLFN